MEDWDMLAADCVVISCCCQCLILQVLILVLLKLPYKLVKKTKEYAKKFQERRKNRRVIEKGRSRDSKDEYLESFSIDRRNYDCRGCMEDVEKVFRELSDKGEFAFGSFWGGEGHLGSPLPHFANLEFDNNNVVQYQFIQMVGSFAHSHSHSKSYSQYVNMYKS